MSQLCFVQTKCTPAFAPSSVTMGNARGRNPSDLSTSMVAADTLFAVDWTLKYLRASDDPPRAIQLQHRRSLLFFEEA